MISVLHALSGFQTLLSLPSMTKTLTILLALVAVGFMWLSDDAVLA